MIGRWTVVNAILVVVILALGIQIARTWLRTLPPTGLDATAEAEGGDGRRTSSRASVRHKGDAEGVVAAITEKDLFDATRSGTADGEVASAAPVEPPPPPGVVVVGVRLIGTDAEAIVEDTAATKQQRLVRTGDSIGDYTVDQIRETSIVLTAETGESVTLWLEFGAGAGTPPAPAQARAPAVSTPPAAATGTVDRAARRGAAQRAARRRARTRRARQGNGELPQGVRDRLEALRRNR